MLYLLLLELSVLVVDVHSRLLINPFFTNAHFTSCQESMCHQMLGEEADRRYGEHRMWASVGWGLMAAVSGRNL